MARITYITNTAKNIRMVKSRTVLLKVSASPCRLARTVGGTTSAAVLVMKSVASPIATPGFRLKKIVTLVNWFRWFTDCGPRVDFHVTSVLSGTKFWPSSDLIYSNDKSSGFDLAESLTSSMTWYWSSGFLIR